jgi:hypothetical protein
VLSSNANPLLFSSPIIANEREFGSFMPRTRNFNFDPEWRSGCENVFFLILQVRISVAGASQETRVESHPPYNQGLLITNEADGSWKQALSNFLVATYTNWTH